MPKELLIEALPSLAVTVTEKVPTSSLAGVPEKVLVAGVKLSQLGRGSPLSRVALRVRVSPSSRSAKVSAGTVKEKGESSVAR